jgi:hypothetical protein
VGNELYLCADNEFLCRPFGSRREDMTGAWRKLQNKELHNLHGIALGSGLDDRVSRVRFPAEAGNFSLHHRVKNGSGSHPASYPMGNRGYFLGAKRPGREAENSPPSSPEVKE